MGTCPEPSPSGSLSTLGGSGEKYYPSKGSWTCTCVFSHTGTHPLRLALTLGAAALSSGPSTRNPASGACWLRETHMGMSSPEASIVLAAVMTLRVTNTKSKVVIVHLEEGRQRC